MPSQKVQAPAPKSEEKPIAKPAPKAEPVVRYPDEVSGKR